jgi:pimeloyl-ACP methyl ester carboxylesterase
MKIQGIDLEEFNDLELKKFEVDVAAPIPTPTESDYVTHDGARIWYAAFGPSGPPVVLLHGGLGHSGNWSYQVPALLASGYRVILIDTRGHGRSTRDTRPYTYELLASDVLAVMARLRTKRAAFVGWSDGACTSLMIAATEPTHVAGVFFFACNMHPNGAKDPFDASPLLDRCLSRHVADYAKLSSTPDQFTQFSKDVGRMQRNQPNYSARDLAAIGVPVVVAHAEHDEFIKREHAEYLAKTIPNARYLFLPQVSHFAPLQKPSLFNPAVLSSVTEFWKGRHG